MNGIGWAVKEMQNGAKVARIGWNGKGMFLYHVAYIAMFTAQGTVVPWLCSQSDLLATDWVVV